MPSYTPNSTLNVDLAFEYAPAPSITFNDKQSPLFRLSDDWGLRFDKMLYDLGPEIGKRPLAKHIGKESTYTFKLELTHQLQLLFYRLIGALDSRLGPVTQSISRSLLTTLIEDIVACTPGFHIRVNLLVHAMQRASSLPQLLCKVRTSLVAKVAANMTNEIHAHNRVFCLAHAEGFGNIVSFKADPFKSKLSDNDIRANLCTKFNEEYTPCKIPQLLCDELRGVLVELEYVGPHESNQSYTTFQVEAMGQCISSSFYQQPINIQEDYFSYFIIDDETQCISDLNWPRIRKLFFQALLQQDYFKPNLLEYARFNALQTSEELLSESIYIKKMLKSKQENELLKELADVLTELPDYYQMHLIKNNLLIEKIKSLADFCRNNNRFIHPDNVVFIKGWLEFMISINREERALYIPIIKSVLMQISRHGPPFGRNLLMLALRYRSDISVSILNLLTCYKLDFGVDFILQLIQQEDVFGNNALMLAATYDAEGALALLAFVGEHLPNLDDLSLWSILTQKDKDSFYYQGKHPTGALTAKRELNLLMLAARYNAQLIKPILAFLANVEERLTSATRESLLLQVDSQGESALMMATKYNPEAAMRIWEFVLERHQILGTEYVLHMIMNKNKKKENILTLAEHDAPVLRNGICHFLLDHLNSDTNPIFLDKKCKKILSHYMFERLFVMNIENEINPSLIEKMFTNHSHLLLNYFPLMRPQSNHRSLFYVVKQFVEIYLKELEGTPVDRAGFFGRSKIEKKTAALALLSVLTMGESLDSGLRDLKSTFTGLKNGRLGRLFRACEIVAANRLDLNFGLNDSSC